MQLTHIYMLNARLKAVSFLPRIKSED